jgi:hypothetical protein
MVAEHSTILFSRNRLYHYQRTRPLTAHAMAKRIEIIMREGGKSHLYAPCEIYVSDNLVYELMRGPLLPLESHYNGMIVRSFTL